MRQTKLTSYFNDCLPLMDSKFFPVYVVVMLLLLDFWFLFTTDEKPKHIHLHCKMGVANLKPKSLECVNALNLMCIMSDHITEALVDVGPPLLLRHRIGESLLLSSGRWEL